MIVSGDPRVLNDVGARLVVAATESRHPLNRFERGPRFAPSAGVLGAPDVRMGVGNEADAEVLTASMHLHFEADAAVRMLTRVMVADAYHLQRSARELDEAGGGSVPQPTPLPQPPTIPPSISMPISAHQVGPPRAVTPVQPRETT